MANAGCPVTGRGSTEKTCALDPPACPVLAECHGSVFLSTRHAAPQGPGGSGLEYHSVSGPGSSRRVT